MSAKCKVICFAQNGTIPNKCPTVGGSSKLDNLIFVPNIACYHIGDSSGSFKRIVIMVVSNNQGYHRIAYGIYVIVIVTAGKHPRTQVVIILYGTITDSPTNEVLTFLNGVSYGAIHVDSLSVRFQLIFLFCLTIVLQIDIVCFFISKLNGVGIYIPLGNNVHIALNVIDIQAFVAYRNPSYQLIALLSGQLFLYGEYCLLTVFNRGGCISNTIIRPSYGIEYGAKDSHIIGIFNYNLIQVLIPTFKDFTFDNGVGNIALYLTVMLNVYAIVEIAYALVEVYGINFYLICNRQSNVTLDRLGKIERRTRIATQIPIARHTLFFCYFGKSCSVQIITVYYGGRIEGDIVFVVNKYGMNLGPFCVQRHNDVTGSSEFAFDFSGLFFYRLVFLIESVLNQ